MRSRLVFLLSLALVWNSWGSFVLTPENLHKQVEITFNQHLLELHQAFKPQYNGYFALGAVWLPSFKQSSFLSPYGEHYGFAFRQQAALLWQNPIEQTAFKAGFAWWGERQGFDSQDFIFFPSYDKFSSVRNLHSFALLLSNTQLNANFAMGLQWSHSEFMSEFVGKEKDSLRYFATLGWNFLTIQGVINHRSLQGLMVHADLASRSLRGQNSSGWRTYLPDLAMILPWEDKNTWQLSWRQNLYGQKLYLHSKWWPKQEQRWESSLQWFMDASQLVGMELSYLQKAPGESFWGIGVEMPFVRVAYNLPRDFHGFFHSKSTIIVEWQLSIGSNEKNEFFGLNAAQSAPMETQVKSAPAAVKEADRTLEGNE
ncbi:MAG: hypothetical protein GX801_02790 [Fibrobacter sp.]|nr:hypothetical protein [Fibrobacter sp.]